MAKADEAVIIGGMPGVYNKSVPWFPQPRISEGARMAQLLGLTKVEFLKRFPKRFYLLPKREDVFNHRRARETAERIRPLLVGEMVLLAGAHVWYAFGFKRHLCAPYKVYSMDGEQWYALLIPHPAHRTALRTVEERILFRRFVWTKLEWGDGFVPMDGIEKPLPTRWRGRQA